MTSIKKLNIDHNNIMKVHGDLYRNVNDTRQKLNLQVTKYENILRRHTSFDFI